MDKNFRHELIGLIEKAREEREAKERELYERNKEKAAKLLEGFKEKCIEAAKKEEPSIKLKVKYQGDFGLGDKDGHLVFLKYGVAYCIREIVQNLGLYCEFDYKIEWHQGCNSYTLMVYWRCI